MAPWWYLSIELCMDGIPLICTDWCPSWLVLCGPESNWCLVWVPLYGPMSIVTYWSWHCNYTNWIKPHCVDIMMSIETRMSWQPSDSCQYNWKQYELSVMPGSVGTLVSFVDWYLVQFVPKRPSRSKLVWVRIIVTLMDWCLVRLAP